jgi:UDP-N-acetylglucosamine--N-acetylmuramyl-(pentapeptide) pyrophosphoryl-undecaprenol N-acetylglucosamine transferase
LVLFFESLLQDEQQQQQLSQNIKRLALPEATSRIVDEIVKLIKNNKAR